MFKTHSIYSEECNVMNTAKDVFKILYSKEWYRTMGFNELSLGFVTCLSYRQSAKKLNRVRNEKEGTPVRTLSNIVETEGEKIQAAMLKKTKDILYDNNFSEEGIPIEKGKDKIYIPDKRKIKLSNKTVEAKIMEYNKGKQEHLQISMEQKEKFYENTENTVNISIDDVSVKKQKDERLNTKEKSQNEKNNMLEIL